MARASAEHYIIGYGEDNLGSQGLTRSDPGSLPSMYADDGRIFHAYLRSRGIEDRTIQ